MDDLESSQSIGGHRFPKVEMLEAKNSYFRKKSHSGRAEGPIGGQISSWKTDCVRDLSSW